MLTKTMPMQDEGVSGELHPWSSDEEGEVHLRIALMYSVTWPIWEVLHLLWGIIVCTAGKSAVHSSVCTMLPAHPASI